MSCIAGIDGADGPVCRHEGKSQVPHTVVRVNDMRGHAAVKRLGATRKGLINLPFGPELPAPRTDRPDFQQDDQSGAVTDPETEGADPRPPSAELVVPADPDLAEPVPPPAMPQP